ncbi:MAG: phosphatidate cytidylyltransferase [Candidatus Izimaplasma sp.]|nr:phosphatidate cytidylyltransferase [Candidatus Izimaplasma bacterium]
MKQRILTGTVIAIITIPIIVIGGWLLVGLFGLFSVIATYEIYHLPFRDNNREWYLYTTEILLSSLIYIFLVLYVLTIIPLSYAIVMIFVTLLVAFYYYYTLKQSFSLFLTAILYPSIGFAGLFAFREAGLLEIGYLFLITVVTDVFAYIIGINFGKHRLAPSISPKKSIEGSIGGVAFTLLFTAVYIALTSLRTLLEIETSFIGMIVLALFISVFAQAGDLVASKLKRNYQVKDFSNLFPGHGGVMDRFDSVLFVSVIIFVMSVVILV